MGQTLSSSMGQTLSVDLLMLKPNFLSHARTGFSLPLYFSACDCPVTLINPPSVNMAEKPSVIMTFPMSPYLEHEIETRYTLVKLWEEQNQDRRHFESVNAVVCNTKVGADASLIDSLPQLGIVSTYSVGLDKIDLDRCRGRGIRVTNTPDVLTDDVADLAIGLALAVMRKVCAGDGFVRDGSWKEETRFGLGSKFSGKSVGIIGLGRIGSAIAKRAEAFNCTIRYHSRTKKPNTNYKYYPDIIDLASNSQILFVSCALTQETRHIVNRRVIEALGPKGILVNIGRGAHVDESELVSALSEGRLGGAGLDVFENEPNVFGRLFGLSNVVMVPHVGSDTVETCKDMADLVLANLVAHFSNKPLLTPVL